MVLCTDVHDTSVLYHGRARRTWGQGGRCSFSRELGTGSTRSGDEEEIKSSSYRRFI